MADVIQNVIVVGVGGTIGPTFLAKLRTAGFNVSILAREASKATYPTDITVHRTDLSHSSLVKAFHDIDAVVSAVATFNVPDQFAMIDAAVEAKVKRFLPSEYGGDASLPDLENIAPFAVQKQKVVEYLETKESQGLSWTALSVGAFFDYLFGYGYGLMGFHFDEPKVQLFDNGVRPLDATTMNQVGLAVAATLQHLEETKNKRIYVNSFSVSQSQIVEAFEILSGKTFERTEGSTKDLIAAGKAHIEDGNWDLGYPESVTAALYSDTGFGYSSGRASEWNKVLGLSEESLDVCAKELLQSKGWI
ncbi:Pinoresinol reductase 2 [Trichoderma lentiforme]|uniref:Pinoresinol reductase 2 n=1 Tax=Trichoderma lentiforme TaxID=1567552 RepID=A0A9P4XCX0_9HYPO|nr:Pinoresinol reductase 2 [Trichoderma lentiforme]